MKKTLVLFALASSVCAASSAAEWKEINNRKNHLYGYELSEGDLFMQPVIVCRFDPGEEITWEQREKDGKGRYLRLRPTVGETLARVECVNVPSRKLEKKELQQLKKIANKRGAVYGYPWYSDFGLVEEPANKDGVYPFYYVVSSEGKVVYSGTSGSKAAAEAMKDARKYAESYTELLGAYKPTVHAELAGELKFGESIEPVAKKLRPLAAARKDSDKKTDAANILLALDQSRTYWYKVMKHFNDPGMKVIVGGQAAKTFPRDKELYMTTVQQILANPAIAKAVKMFQQIYAYKQKMPEKKAEIAKGYKIVCNGEKACVKARKDYGDKLPYAFTSLENLVMEVKAEFEALGCGQK